MIRWATDSSTHSHYSSHAQSQEYQGQRLSSLFLDFDLQEAKQHSFLLIVCHYDNFTLR